MDHTYWQKQIITKPLFPDIEWNKPEQKTRAGKLLIIGGNAHGFAATAEAYSEAIATGAGQVKVLLPDKLKKAIPATISDAVFAPSNPSGSLSIKAERDVKTALLWADHCLLIGDAGRNSETAMVYEQIIAEDTPLTVTRDAVDLLRPVSDQLVNREVQTTLVVSFAQLQKIFQAIYFPKIISFSMQLTLFVEILHKFSLSYPCTIVTFHQQKIIVADKGGVVTQEFEDPVKIWRGSTATRAACYQLWSESKPLEAIATSFS